MTGLDFLTGLLDAPAKQSGSLTQTAHRPWPLPRRGWTMGQTWEDLLFAHWRVPVDVVRPHVPAELEIDTHDGTAWIGITPFRISGVRLRGMLPLPAVSSFLELNVRTYVTSDGKPGIWFFSLDASSELAVQAARLTYRLPYFRARMLVGRRDGWFDYECARREEPGRVWNGRYRTTGPVLHPEPGSLEWFLTERYCLYTTGEGGELQRAEIHHGPWPLQTAECEVELNTISRVELPDEAPVCHFSGRQDVLIWSLEPVRATA